MQTIESALIKEMHQLEKIVREAEIRLKTAPKGHVRIMKKRGNIEYYLKSDNINSNNGRYMKKSEINLARVILNYIRILRSLRCRQGKKCTWNI